MEDVNNSSYARGRSEQSAWKKVSNKGATAVEIRASEIWNEGPLTKWESKQCGRQS